MARYRPVDTRLWSDRKFLACNDDGRLLWLFLLTCASSLSIPGVIVAGEASMAEDLGWTSKRLREGFGDISRKGLRMAREGRTTWLQNALRYERPSSPNVVKFWAKSWDDVPEGPLKIEIWGALRSACKQWNNVFVEGFPEPLPEPLPEVSPNGSAQDQDQDQEQNQDQRSLIPLLQRAPAAPRAPTRAQQLAPTWRPADTAPNRKAEAIATTRGVNLADELQALRDWAAAKGETGKDWDARWRLWISRAQPRRGNGYVRQQTTVEAALERLAIAQAEEAEEGSS